MERYMAKRELTFTQKVEQSILKTYRKDIYAPFVKALIDFKMIEDGDVIGVCISGGKDSMILAKCMQEVQRHGNKKFDLKFIVMNPGYREENIQKIHENLDKLGIPATIFDAPIFEFVTGLEDNPCYMCARMRRGNLYHEAQSLGCNKIALGHHFNDVIETNLMGMIYGGQVQTMMPKVISKNFDGMELIRPLYYVREEAIIRWCVHNELSFLNCACSLTERENDGQDLGKRALMKKLVAELMKDNPHVEDNIFKSMFNVNLGTLIGYHDENKEYSFLDTYESKLKARKEVE